MRRLSRQQDEEAMVDILKEFNWDLDSIIDALIEARNEIAKLEDKIEEMEEN